MFARFLSEYGILFVLLVLCAFFSVMTITEQHPTGPAAGEDLAGAILRQTPPGARVLIVVRNTQDDADFAAALSGILAAEKRVVLDVLRGQPSQTRQAMETFAASGGIDVMASLQGVGADSLLENVQRRHPELARTKLLVPQSYTWPNFLKASNLLNIANQIAVIAIIAIGMTMVIITGGIDLSVGSLMALAAVLTTLLIRDALGGYQAGAGAMVLAGLTAMMVCGLVGLITGILVTGFEVPPFIATLGMMLIARGLAQTFSNNESISEVPVSFSRLGRGADLASLPNAVVLMALLYLVAHVVMTRTVLGRYIYAVGGNAEAARLSGVPVARVIMLVYVVCGLLAGLGGVILASQFQSANPNYGQMYELYVIAAAVVGGTSLSGGEGKIVGTLLGAFLIAVIQNGMNLTGVPSNTQMVVLGLVILIAVVFDRLKKSGWLKVRSRLEA